MRKFFKNNSKKKSTRKQPDAVLQKRIHESLLEAIEVRKIHHRNGLTIDELAKSLDTNREYLSQVINKHYGRFSEFINKHRIKDGIKIISNPDNKYKIATIARDVGFKSLSVFIAEFKKETGLTPSNYKKKRENE